MVFRPLEELEADFLDRSLDKVHITHGTTVQVVSRIFYKSESFIILKVEDESQDFRVALLVEHW